MDVRSRWYGYRGLRYSRTPRRSCTIMQRPWSGARNPIFVVKLRKPEQSQEAYELFQKVRMLYKRRGHEVEIRPIGKNDLTTGQCVPSTGHV